MTLEEKLYAIEKPALSDKGGIGLLPEGKEGTIEEFFENFVKPRLPKENVIKEWHKALMRYTEKSNWPELSCCVRFGNNGSKKKSKWGETDYFKLRRGWLTKNRTDNFEYFFADNSFPAFVYKMALDGVYPSDVCELQSVFQQHKFPYSFGFFIDNKKNEFRGVVIPQGKNPGFLGNYKLSHIFDAGEHFNVAGKEMGDAKLSDVYYPIGHTNDFLRETDRIRRMDISDVEKEVIVAKFLRFAHPFNYFLTPTQKRHICGKPVYKKDIGEDPRMISYMRWYLKETYPHEYNEFVEKIMWYGSTDGDKSMGKERIDIVYGPDVDSKSAGKTSGMASCTKKDAKGKTVKRVSGMIDKNRINDKKYLEGFKVGEIANQALRYILKDGVTNGKITKADIEKFKTEKGRRTSVFMLSQPVLLVSRIAADGRVRGYTEPIDCYGELLYINSQWQENDKEIKNNLIEWIVAWANLYYPTKSKSKAGVSPFADFEKKMEQAGLKSGKTYSSLIRKIMAELGIASIQELNQRLDEAIEYCENMRKERKEDKGRKKYRDAISALRKYKELLNKEFPSEDLLNNGKGNWSELYIRYERGWQSFVPVGEHVTRYCIQDNEITISSDISFMPGPTVVKKINVEDMGELLSILNEAYDYNLFAKSNTSINTVHGKTLTYEYTYRGKSGIDCGRLFEGNSRADVLQTRYNKLIEKLLK